MKAKKVLIIVLTVLVFLSCSVLGISSVYRVDVVFVSADTISQEAETERLELQERLNTAYHKASSLFADEEEVKTALADFPYFRFVAFEKDYPNRLVVRVVEDMEVYAAVCDETAGTYYILNADGMILGVREGYVNRSDETGQSNNILLSGVEITGERGEMATGGEDFNGLLAFCKKADELLDGIRRNIVSVTYLQRANVEATATLKLTTAEGVNIYVHEPAVAPESKAVEAMQTYLGLADGERTHGMIAVAGTAESVTAVYSPNDIFAEEN